MIIGIPKEIKNNENRVGATPAGVKELVKHGHEVYVQQKADSPTKNISSQGPPCFRRSKMSTAWPR